MILWEKKKPELFGNNSDLFSSLCYLPIFDGFNSFWGMLAIREILEYPKVDIE